jgi:uncharacterized phage protein (TIGR01671 family)
MEDRFKFRAWDKDDKVMIDNVQGVYDGGNFDFDVMKGDYLSWARCFGDILNNDEYIVMQSTGLKDKNGTLIFEGDVIKKDHREQLYVVEFCKKGHFAGAFCLKNTESGKFAGFSQESIFMPGDAPRNWDKVIGNIHQNPKLIKGE